MYRFLFILIIYCFHFSFAALTTGPNLETTRALSMGNAFVAIVDDQQAIYHNIAGINFQKKLGRPKKFLRLGYYPPSEHFFSFGVTNSQNFIFAQSVDNILRKPLTKNGPSIKAITSQLANLIINEDSNFANLIQYNRSAIPFFLNIHTEGTLYDYFSVAIWANNEFYPFFDFGFIPRFGHYYTKTDVVIQLASSTSIEDRLSVGVGVRLVYRKERGFKDILLTNPFVSNDTLSILDSLNSLKFTLPIPSILLLQSKDLIGDFGGFLTSFEETITNPIPAVGFDIGILWQQTPELRFGLSLQNLFIPYSDHLFLKLITGLNQKKVIPELTIGLAYSPIILQNNYSHRRKINFALDLEDILNRKTIQSPFLFNYLNIGAEIKQDFGFHLKQFSGNLKYRKALGFRVAAGIKELNFHWGLGLYFLNTLQIDITSWVKRVHFFHVIKSGRIHSLSLKINL